MIFFVIATSVFIVALLLLIGGVIVDNAKLYEDINTLLFDNSQLHERLDNLENTFRLHGLTGIDQEKKDDDYDFFEEDL